MHPRPTHPPIVTSILCASILLGATACTATGTVEATSDAGSLGGGCAGQACDAAHAADAPDAPAIEASVPDSRADVPSDTKGAPPDAPATAEITTYDVTPYAIQNLGIPGFFDPEVTTKVDPATGATQYWLHDKVTANPDDRPRHYYVGYRYVGDSLDFGPILRGGVYKVRCVRYRGDWWVDGNGIESHFVDFAIPGPMMEAGSVQVPKSFQIGPSFVEAHAHLLPKFAAPPGKLNPTYRFTASDTLADLYDHGATHGALWSGETTAAKMELTSAIPVGSGWVDSLGVSNPDHTVDALGEQGFRRATDANLDDAAGHVPGVGLFFTDFEKTSAYGDPATYWSIDIEEPTLPRYRTFLNKVHARNPGMLIGDVYRSLVWSKGFFVEGNPGPADARWSAGLAAPESRARPAFRNFTDSDGTTRSLRDTIDLYTVDGYPWRGMGSGANIDRTLAQYQLYSMVYDALMIRALAPKGKVLFYNWQESDGDTIGRLYFQTKTGVASWQERNQTSASWAMAVEMLGYVVADGSRWWHDQPPNGDDPSKLGKDLQDARWEPAVPGAPSPFTAPWDVGTYPRTHNYPVTYAKLGEYLVAQLGDAVSTWSFASFTVDDGPTFTAHGNQTILDVASARAPIVLMLGTAGHRAILVVHPFGDMNKRYRVRVEVDGAYREVTVVGEWPTLMKL